MKRIIIVLYIIFSLPFIIHAAFSEKFNGARPMALGGSFAPMADDINSIYYNPAGLVSITGLSAGASFMQYYNMNELQNFIISAAYPTEFGAFGISYHSYGFSLYKETQMIFTHGLMFLRKIQFGYNLKYMRLSLSHDPDITPVIEYGSDSLITFDVGCKVEINRNFSAGAYAMNVTSPMIGKNNAEESDQKFTMGVAYKPAGGLTTTLSFDKAIEDEYQIRVGAEMWVYKFVALRGGIQSRPFNFTFGAGVNYNSVYIDYALVNNNLLGETHVFSISVMPGKGIRRDIFISKKKRKRLPSKTEEVYYTGPKININTATAEELTELPRVGPKTAKRIIDDRTLNGPFITKQDITRIKGIGPKTFAKFRHMIMVGEEEEEEEKLKLKGFDINTAQMKEFVANGVSPLSAIKIIKYREAKGGIAGLDELNKIPGVKKEDIEKIKKLVEGVK